MRDTNDTEQELEFSDKLRMLIMLEARIRSGLSHNRRILIAAYRELKPLVAATHQRTQA